MPGRDGCNQATWSQVRLHVGLPGAFTPVCSESHLPGFEALHDETTALGVDEVICVSVNDAFVMSQWGKAFGIEKVRLLPNGNGDLAKTPDKLVPRSDQGMGHRSWRYSMLIVDGEIEQTFAEPDRRNNPPGVPVTVSCAQTMRNYLKQRAT
ncbi:redoxin family protein [Alisedimentitalea sp. MJ-SS2]|uniref:redoxin family protein n=1 Tax=Aliisedimentitalea sp. MJ-SS2 TaxID=3049795 RepID=UPI00290CA3B3|nr:redoxin family protein [Alisedimentitalea sp. MJ-SS2]MDU8927077.1 redoxin family protein [Alisedimentitalea sp. MJ-SS2]